MDQLYWELRIVQHLASFSPFLIQITGLYKLGRAGADPAQRMRLISTLGAYVMASTALYHVQRRSRF